MGQRDDLRALACAARKGESFKVTEKEKPARVKVFPPVPMGQPTHPWHSQEPLQDHDCARQLKEPYPGAALGNKAAGR